jgi:hypothetical protein
MNTSTIDMAGIRADVQVVVDALHDIQEYASKGQAAVDRAREACQRLDQSIGPNLYTDETISELLSDEASHIDFTLEAVPTLLAGWCGGGIRLRLLTLTGWLEKLKAIMDA